MSNAFSCKIFVSESVYLKDALVVRRPTFRGGSEGHSVFTVTHDLLCVMGSGEIRVKHICTVKSVAINRSADSWRI